MRTVRYPEPHTKDQSKAALEIYEAKTTHGLPVRVTYIDRPGQIRIIESYEVLEFEK